MTRKIHPVLVGHCEACGVPMMSKDRWTKLGRAAAEVFYPGFKPKGADGLCRAHHARKLRSGSPIPAPVPAPVRTCSLPECSEPHDARGLCKSHYKAAWGRGQFETKPSLSAEDVLDDWALIRDAGETNVRRAAERIGMTWKALDQALYRARKKGDPRGSLQPYAHDMRRHAA